MTISNEQKNLIDNLRVPIKSFRIFALEEVIKSGGNSEILSVLEEIKIIEDDPECLMLINHAINSIQDKLSGAKTDSTVSVIDSSEFLNNWKNADENKKMQIISNLPPRLPKEIRSIGPQLLENSSSIVQARVIRTFSRGWPEESFNLITNNLESDSLVLKLASLRTMVHLKPELLLNDLPALLVSTDPEIKALAIRGLAKIDKEEALNHLQALLLSSNKTDRLAGIQNCPFLPFDMVKPLLLKYFAAETNQELLTKAGWIIEMNPDTEVPFSLYEIAERSPAKKSNLVKKVLSEAVNLLKKSGILGNQFAAYTKKLQEWVNKRNALRYVKQMTAKLDSPIIPVDIENNILVATKQPLFKETFIEAYNTWPLSDIAKSHLARYLGIKNNTSENSETNKILNDNNIEQPIQNQVQSDTINLNNQQSNSIQTPSKNLSQFEMLATITPDKAAEKLNQITLMISHKNSSTDLKIAALQCLTRCRLSGVEDIATRLIKHKEITLATAAVEYLGIVNPDAIFPYLGQCLNVADVGMKSVALGILKNFDYNQAVSYLRTMLYSSEKSQQNMAMECINQFDFALVRDMLTEFLCSSYPEDLLEAGLCHFAANPSADNTYSLYKIEQAHQGKIAQQAKALREACPEPEEQIATVLTDNSSNSKSVNKNLEETKKAKEEELKERLKVEKEKKASKRPAYAYRSASEDDKRTSKEQLKMIWEAIVNFCKSKALPITTVIMIVTVVLVWILFFPHGNSQTTISGSALVTSKVIVEGEVKKVKNGIVTFSATDNNIYILKPIEDRYKIPNEGDKLRAVLLPYRKADDGRIAVKILKLRKITEYSKEYSGNKAK